MGFVINLKEETKLFGLLILVHLIDELEGMLLVDTKWEVISSGVVTGSRRDIKIIFGLETALIGMTLFITVPVTVSLLEAKSEATI